MKFVLCLLVTSLSACASAPPYRCDYGSEDHHRSTAAVESWRGYTAVLAPACTFVSVRVGTWENSFYVDGWQRSYFDAADNVVHYFGPQMAPGLVVVATYGVPTKILDAVQYPVLRELR